MYASGRRFGLGETALDPSLTFVVEPGDVGASSPDPTIAVGSPGSGDGGFALTPTVVLTPGTQYTPPLPPPLYGPDAIGPTSGAAPTPAVPVAPLATNWSSLLLWGGVALFATYTLRKGRR